MTGRVLTCTCSILPPASCGKSTAPSSILGPRVGRRTASSCPWWSYRAAPSAIARDSTQCCWRIPRAVAPRGTSHPRRENPLAFGNPTACHGRPMENRWPLSRTVSFGRFLSAESVSLLGCRDGGRMRSRTIRAGRPTRSIVYLSVDQLRRVFLDDGHVEKIPLELSWTPAIARGRKVIHAGRLFDGKLLTYRTNVDILIEDNRIKDVLPRRNDWRDAEVIDASGQVVIPGLFENHVHN